MYLQIEDNILITRECVAEKQNGKLILTIAPMGKVIEIYPPNIEIVWKCLCDDTYITRIKEGKASYYDGTAWLPLYKT